MGLAELRHPSLKFKDTPLVLRTRSGGEAALGLFRVLQVTEVKQNGPVHRRGAREHVGDVLRQAGELREDGGPRRGEAKQRLAAQVVLFLERHLATICYRRVGMIVEDGNLELLIESC